MEVTAAGRDQPGPTYTDHSHPKSRPAPGLRPAAANGPRCHALIPSSATLVMGYGVGGEPLFVPLIERIEHSKKNRL